MFLCITGKSLFTILPNISTHYIYCLFRLFWWPSPDHRHFNVLFIEILVFPCFLHILHATLTNNSLISIKVYAYCNLNPLAFFELFPLLLLIITLLCRTILTCRLHRSAAWKWFPPFHHWSLCLKSMGGLLSSFLLSNNVLTVMACRKIYGAVIVCTEYLSMLLTCLFIAE